MSRTIELLMAIRQAMRLDTECSLTSGLDQGNADLNDTMVATALPMG